jgi:two-component system sensor histidine kinase UhpB
MRLRTRLNLVVAALSGIFVIVLIAAEIQGTRASVREEIEAANRVASQLLGELASIYSNIGGPDLVLQFLQQTGRVRANEVSLLAPTGEVLYRSPRATYKAGREAPRWFARLLAPQVTKVTFPLRGGVLLVIEPQPSRAVLDAWDGVVRLAVFGVGMIVLVNAAAFYSVARAVERQNREAEARLEERREMATLADQRVEEERRLIAHELHDEFGQSVTAIRSLALAIAAQAGERDRSTAEVARLISDEAARLYDAMHGLIPRLAPLSLDTPGLTATLENLARDWQRRYPSVTLALHHDLPPDLGPGITLVIYRVVQEGVINALRHACASRVSVDVSCAAGRIVVTVTDDGIGLPAEWSKPGHFGLRGLTDRVTRLGGSFRVDNRPPRGARVMAEIPLPVSA